MLLCVCGSLLYLFILPITHRRCQSCFVLSSSAAELALICGNIYTTLNYITLIFNDENLAGQLAANIFCVFLFANLATSSMVLPDYSMVYIYMVIKLSAVQHLLHSAVKRRS